MIVFFICKIYLNVDRLIIMNKILNKIRVLDIGRYVAGPYAATLLGYMGAEVIRVEKVSGGEDRYIAPITSGKKNKLNVGGLFMQTGCGKKSITLNLSTERGRNILKKLASQVDVVIANIPPKTLKKLGLDWHTFSTNNPKGILVTQTGFGSKGPDKDKGGFDGVAQAMSGAMYLSGTSDLPVKAGAPYVDFSTAIFSAMGALAAIIERNQTGKGQHVETSLLGTALACMNSHLAEQSVTQLNRQGTGNQVQTSAPSDVFKTKDGHILVHTVGDGLFKRWAKLVEREELTDDPLYIGDQARGDNRAKLISIMTRWSKSRTTQRALHELQEAGIPSGPILSLQEALDNPQVKAMNFFTNVSYPGLDSPAPVARLPIEFSNLNTGITNRPPLLGEHTKEILTSLKFSKVEIEDLRKDGIV